MNSLDELLQRGIGDPRALAIPYRIDALSAQEAGAIAQNEDDPSEFVVLRLPIAGFDIQGSKMNVITHFPPVLRMQKSTIILPNSADLGKQLGEALGPIEIRLCLRREVFADDTDLPEVEES